VGLDNLDGALADSWMEDMSCYHPVFREDNVVGNTQEDDRATSAFLTALLLTSTFLGFNDEAACVNAVLSSYAPRSCRQATFCHGDVDCYARYVSVVHEKSLHNG